MRKASDYFSLTLTTELAKTFTSKFRTPETLVTGYKKKDFLQVVEVVPLTEPQSAPESGDSALEHHRAERRGLYNTFGTAWSSAFETALAPLLVAGIGWLLDRWLGTFPALTIVFLLIGAAGAGARLFYAYRTKMELEEANRPWAPTNPAWAEDDEEQW